MVEGQECPDLAIQALHGKQLEQLSKLRSDGVDFNSLEGVSAEEMAIMYLQDQGLTASEIWVGRPTQWLRRMLYVRQTALELPTESCWEDYAAFWGADLLRATSVTGDHLRFPDAALQASPVVALVNYSVGVSEEEEVGHYNGIPDISEEWQGLMGVDIDYTQSDAAITARAQVLHDVYRSSEGRERYVQMVQERTRERQEKMKGVKRAAASAKRATKRKPNEQEAVVRKSARVPRSKV
jgi:hypothetical protein